MLLIIIYLIGSVLAFGLYAGVAYSITSEFVPMIKPKYKHPLLDWNAWLCAALSWVGALLAIYAGISHGCKPILKYSYKKLWDKCNPTKQ